MTMQINGTSGLVFNDASTQNTAATGFGFKNRIINGAMMIDQRNAGASQSISADTGFWATDRFRVGAAGGGVFTAQQSTTAPTGFSNSLLLTVTTADSSLASSDLYYTRHWIEGFNTADLMWGTANAATVTLSFQVRSSVTGTFSGSFTNSDYSRSYPFTYVINSANTWETKTVTVAGDTTGTWIGATNGRGIGINFNIGSGSGNLTTAGSWTSGTYFGATGQTNLIATSGATFYITGVQLEKGSTATSFDYRPYGTELALCQRYYVASINNASGGFTGTPQASGYTEAIGQASFKVTMRAIPTVILFDGGSNASGSATQLAVADNIPATASNINVNGFNKVNRNSGAWSSGANFQIVAGFSASAEL